MKYLLMVSIIILSGVVGRKLSKVFVIRDLFFKEMTNLCVFIKNNINFNQSKIEDIFNEYLTVCDKENVVAIKCLKQCLINENFESLINDNLTFCFLNKEEKLMLVKFMKGLGLASNDIESYKIDEFLNYLNKVKEEASLKRKKNEGMIYKLSLMVGAVVCILIL